jgi:hypothetical protein
MCAMSDNANANGRARAATTDGGVLGNLPRTRPQRSSARRAAARKGAAPAATQTPPGKRTSRQSPAKPRVKAKRAPSPSRATGSAPVQEPVPRQGFESDSEIASGPVQPPGATELVSSAAELAGELAKAGVTGGARLLKELLSRLPPG